MAGGPSILQLPRQGSIITEFSLIDAGGFITPMSGGKVQRINRLGSRFAMIVTLPPMTRNETSDAVMLDLLRGTQELIKVFIPSHNQNTFDTLGGAVVTNGALSASTDTFQCSGADLNKTIHKGRWVNVGTQLYKVKSANSSNSLGAIQNLEVWPLLRTSHDAGTSIGFDNPCVQGYIDNDELDWEMALKRYEPLQFVIREEV